MTAQHITGLVSSVADEILLRQEGFFTRSQLALWNERWSGKPKWQHYLGDVLMFRAWLGSQ